METEEDTPYPHADREDDTAATDDDARMGTPEIRFVADTEMLRYPEIDQFCKQQHDGYCNVFDNVTHSKLGYCFANDINVFFSPSMARTGICSTPSASLIFALELI